MSTLKELRHKIDQIDTSIIKKLAQRNKLSKKIGQLKEKANKHVVDINRESELMKKYEVLCVENQLPITLVKRLFRIIISNSRRLQK